MNYRAKPLIFTLFTVLTASILQGCTAVAVGTAATGATAAHDRRTIGTFVEDQDIFIHAIRLKNADKDLQKRSNIGIDVYNLQVVMTGQAEDADLVARYREKISKIPRVTKVYDEVNIGAESTWGDEAQDTYLTSKVKLALFDIGIKGFDPTRVKVTSSLGSVYLMGILTQNEADAVTEKVRFVSGVKRVVRLFEYIQH